METNPGFNQVEPKDGYDVYTTIRCQYSGYSTSCLLEQLENYKADHGCVVVMETKTGEVKAISNLGRNKNGTLLRAIKLCSW